MEDSTARMRLWVATAGVFFCFGAMFGLYIAPKPITAYEIEIDPRAYLVVTNEANRHYVMLKQKTIGNYVLLEKLESEEKDFKKQETSKNNKQRENGRKAVLEQLLKSKP